MEGDFARQSAFGEEFERTINGRVADPGIFFLHQTVQFLGRKMVASFKKGPKNRVALGGLLQARLFQMIVKDALGLADHLREIVG